MQGEVEALVGGQCAFCPDPECLPVGAENLLRRLPHLLGPLLGPIHVADCEEEEVFVHSVCAIWTPEVYYCEKSGKLRGISTAHKRGRLMRCVICDQRGATLGCRKSQCPRPYHFVCAHLDGCEFLETDYLISCRKHALRRRKRRRDATEGMLQRLPWLPKEMEPVVQQLELGIDDAARWNRPKMKRQMEAAAEGRMRSVMAAAARLAAASAPQEESDEARFLKKQRRRMAKERGRLAPTILGAYTSPLGEVDAQHALNLQGFRRVAGHGEHVRELKEMVMLPLLYPDLFQVLQAGPPSGVLLHGEPGTGKTLVVRALAEECARCSGTPVAFFARKGADCLGKYSGDAELMLRLLFEEAQRHAPSIVFFDELDGLVPVRGSGGEGDQIYASVVSTLLALLDGLQSRGQVVVIGATNRPDNIDPALRRPGRFDRELYFGLPSASARAAILQVHTKQWQPPPSEPLLAAVAEATQGYCGADLAALCTSVVLRALERVHPGVITDDDSMWPGPQSKPPPAAEPELAEAQVGGAPISTEDNKDCIGKDGIENSDNIMGGHGDDDGDARGKVGADDNDLNQNNNKDVISQADTHDKHHPIESSRNQIPDILEGTGADASHHKHHASGGPQPLLQNIQATAEDWIVALTTAQSPCSRRSKQAALKNLLSGGKALPSHLVPVLEPSLRAVLRAVQQTMLGVDMPPLSAAASQTLGGLPGGDGSCASAGRRPSQQLAPQFWALVCGDEGNGQQALASAVIQAFQGCQVHSINMPQLILAAGGKSVLDGCMHLLRKLQPERGMTVIHLPHLETWALQQVEDNPQVAPSQQPPSTSEAPPSDQASCAWEMCAYAISELASHPHCGPVLVVGTSGASSEHVPEAVLAPFREQARRDQGLVVELQPLDTQAQREVLKEGVRQVLERIWNGYTVGDRCREPEPSARGMRATSTEDAHVHSPDWSEPGQVDSELKLRRAACRAAHVSVAQARSLAAQLTAEMQQQTQAFAKQLRRSPRTHALMVATLPDQQLVKHIIRGAAGGDYEDPLHFQSDLLGACAIARKAARSNFSVRSRRRAWDLAQTEAVEAAAAAAFCMDVVQEWSRVNKPEAGARQAAHAAVMACELRLAGARENLAELEPLGPSAAAPSTAQASQPCSEQAYHLGAVASVAVNPAPPMHDLGTDSQQAHLLSGGELRDSVGLQNGTQEADTGMSTQERRDEILEDLQPRAGGDAGCAGGSIHMSWQANIQHQAKQITELAVRCLSTDSGEEGVDRGEGESTGIHASVPDWPGVGSPEQEKVYGEEARTALGRCAGLLVDRVLKWLHRVDCDREGRTLSRLTVKQMENLLAAIRARILSSAQKSQMVGDFDEAENSHFGSSYLGIIADDARHVSARQKQRLWHVVDTLQHAESRVQDVVENFIEMLELGCHIHI